jgi:ketosteroid isomerase-like protein
MIKSKLFLFIGLLLTVVIISCKSKTEENTNTPTAADVTSVENTVTNFSDAIAAADTTTLQKLVSPDFVLLDEGKDFDYALMIQQIKTLKKMGTMIRKPQMFKTVIHNDIAWTYYQVSVNYLTQQQKSINLSLLESAVLEKNNDGWSIVMMTTSPQPMK